MAQDATLRVEGMDCAACERRLGAALTRLKGVITAKADHRAARVDVRFDPDRVSEQDIRQRIRAAGFDAPEAEG